MRVDELMTRDPATCGPDDTVQTAAGLMEEHDCGLIPVVEDGELTGVITDRDLAVRVLALGKSASLPVREAMSERVQGVSPDTDVDEVLEVMAEYQVRRVPVVDEAGRLVGIVSQADLARQDVAASDEEVGEVVEEISEPTGKARV